MAWCIGLFWIWNDHTIRRNSDVITTSAYWPPSWILGTRSYTSMIVLQSTVNESTYEVLYNALMGNKTQLRVGGVSCRYYFSISGDVINDAEIM